MIFTINKMKILNIFFHEYGDKRSTKLHFLITHKDYVTLHNKTSSIKFHGMDLKGFCSQIIHNVILISEKYIQGRDEFKKFN
jgi:hypothetical protein